MARGLILLLASLVLAPALSTAQEPTPDPKPVQEPSAPSFKSGVELVTVAATVRDRKGRLVKGLNANDFEVLDNGERRLITDFRTE
ncbi:MAG: hypothetical protein H0T71_13075, partial [Acidobacteria bacterium]|nr:hypothetical protein [Acidobacteriota bacterium]